MERLNVARPTDVPHATEYVDEMVEMIGQLVEIGRAYTTEDGVYLSVETVEDYGLLAGQRLDQLLEGGGDREVFGAEHKRHPADFVLWKVAKPNEPSWPSPWGDGRPGWHSECVVMSLDLLGEGFDLHCGGMDLKFPHHENERAQAVALGKRFANHWMHNGFVVDAEGEKMSKSLGNVDQPARPHRALRPAGLPDAAAAVALPQPGGRRPGQHRRLGQGARRPRRVRRPRRRRCRHADADAAVIAEFRERMDDDLDTPGATALLFDTVRRANAAIDADDPVAGALVCRRPPHLRCVRAGAQRRRRRPGRGCSHGRRARRRAGREGLRHRRPAAWRAAGRRLDRGDHQVRHHAAPLSPASDRTGHRVEG